MNKVCILIAILFILSLAAKASDEKLVVKKIVSIELDSSKLTQTKIDPFNLDQYPNVMLVQPDENSGVTFTVPESLLQQVEEGNAEVAYFIAEMFRTGNEEYSSNQEKYREWINKAAVMGLPQAVLDYALFMRNDDEKKALEWFHKAADFGMSEAVYQIATFYNLGKAGLEEDCQKAYELYEKAELNKFKVAFNDHAWYLATSLKEECRSPEKAIKLIYQLKAIYKSNHELIPWHVWDTEAAVLASISDFTKAIKLQEWLIKEMIENDIEVKGYEKRLEIYKKRQTYSEYLELKEGYLDSLKKPIKDE